MTEAPGFDAVWQLPGDRPGMVGVRLTDEGQQIGFLLNGWSKALEALLGSRIVSFAGTNGQRWALVEHDVDFDEFLRNLIDLLITLRYSHPTMVQLELKLTETAARELEAVLGG